MDRVLRPARPGARGAARRRRRRARRGRRPGDATRPRAAPSLHLRLVSSATSSTDADTDEMKRPQRRPRPRPRPRPRVARLARRPPGAAPADHRGGGRPARRASCRTARPTRRRRRRARRGLRPRADRDAGRAVLRLRHRRHPSRRARRRLAGQRVGPEHRAAHRSPPPTRRSRTSPRRGCSTCSGSRAESAVGFVTGGTMANFTCLAAARDEVLRRARLGRRGPGAGRLARRTRPRRRRAARHHRPRAALPRARARPSRWPPTTRAGSRPPRSPPPSRRATAGRRSCASRPATCTPAPSTRSSRPSPRPTTRARGCTSTGRSGSSPPPRPTAATSSAGYDAADSWATDAHKTLNVPYDCGLAIVRDRAALRAAMGMHGDYLIFDAAGEPMDKVPEISRRGRAFPVWAVLRSLGRDGVADAGRRLLRPRARPSPTASRPSRAPRCSTTSSSPRCARPSATTTRTRAVVDAMLADGTAWTTGSRWRGRAVLRVSVSNWSTTAADVRGQLSMRCGRAAAR